MKINLSGIISNTLHRRSRTDGIDLNIVESMFKAYRLASMIGSLNPGVPGSDKLFLKISFRYYSRVLQAARKKDFVAAYSLGCPVEILYAMDIVPFQLEATGWLLARLTGHSSQLLSAAGESGLASEICSVHRLMVGAFARGLLPRANAVLWTNMPCENSAKSGALLAALNHCPGFFLDHPCNNTPAEVHYLAEELKNQISFLEEKSGHRLDYDRLKEAVAQSDCQIKLCREISYLRKNVPSPFPSFTFMRVFMAHILFGGQPYATTYLETLRNELIAGIRRGKGTVTPERFRLINLNLPPLCYTGSLESIFREYGAVEVLNPFFLEWQDGTLDASQPLYSLAKKSFMNPLMGIYRPIDSSVLDKLYQFVQEYKIDGAINYAHIGCGAYGGVSRLVRDTLKNAGVPVLDLTCDLTDPTVVTPEEIREQLACFFELLEDR